MVDIEFIRWKIVIDRISISQQLIQLLAWPSGVVPNAVNLTDIARPCCFLGFLVEPTKKGLLW